MGKIHDQKKVSHFKLREYSLTRQTRSTFDASASGLVRLGGRIWGPELSVSPC